MIICDFKDSQKIGKPKDWDEELDGPCAELPVRGEIHEQSGIHFIASVYQLTDKEIQTLVEGGAIRLMIAGYSHPVMSIRVMPPEECQEAEVVPFRDLEA